MLVFRRYRRMLVRAFQVALAAGVVLGFGFGGGMLATNPGGFLGITVLFIVLCSLVAVAALLGAFAAVWLGDRGIEQSPGRRVALSVLGAGLGVAVLAMLLSLVDAVTFGEPSGLYLSVSVFCAVVAAACAGFMASFVEFPGADSADVDHDAPAEDAAALREP